MQAGRPVSAAAKYGLFGLAAVGILFLALLASSDRPRFARPTHNEGEKTLDESVVTETGRDLSTATTGRERQSHPGLIADERSGNPGKAVVEEPSQASDEATQWAEEFNDLPIAELKAILHVEQASFQEAQSEEAVLLAEAGMYELVDEVEMHPNEIVIYMMHGPGQSLKRVALPEDKYPDFYSIQRRLNWMKKRIALLSQDD